MQPQVIIGSTPKLPGGSLRKPLTSLRAFVVFFVFITHLRFLYQGADILDFHETYMGNGDACVTFFFVLSGLSFSLGYGDGFKPLRLRDWGAFIWRRLKKTYPLYIVTVIIMVVWGAIELPDFNVYLRDQTFHLALAATLTQTWNPELNTSMIFNGAAWYLSCIFAIYLVTPLLLRLNHFVRRRPWACRIILVLALVAHFVFEQHLVYGGFTDLMRSELGYFHPAGRVVQFIAGIMLGNLVLAAERGEGAIALADDPVLAGGLEFAALLAWLASFMFTTPLARELVPKGAPLGFQYLISYPIHFLVACLLVWVFAQRSGGVSRFLSAKPFVELGTISFEFFLIHWVIIHVLGARLIGADPSAHLALLVVFIFFASLAFSVMWHWLGEIMHKPFADLEPKTAQNPAE